MNRKIPEIFPVFNAAKVVQKNGQTVMIVSREHEKALDDFRLAVQRSAPGAIKYWHIAADHVEIGFDEAVLALVTRQPYKTLKNLPNINF